MLRGKAFLTQPEAFLQGLKAGLVEGLVKTVITCDRGGLLTTSALEPSHDSRPTIMRVGARARRGSGPIFGSVARPSTPYVGEDGVSSEVRTPEFALTRSGLTKRIVAEKSQRAVTAILVHTSPTPAKLIGHISAAIQDKSVQTRQYGAGHLKTYLEAQVEGHRGLVEGTSGVLEQIQQLLQRCLADTNPLVREQGRLAFWSFEKVWPTYASTLLAALDGSARKQLEKANPRAGSTPGAARISQPKTPRSSAMSALLAAKRAQAAQIAAKRAAEGEDPSQPIIETLPLDGTPNRAPKSPPSAPSEGTVTPKGGLESPTPAFSSPNVSARVAGTGEAASNTVVTSSLRPPEANSLMSTPAPGLENARSNGSRPETPANIPEGPNLIEQQTGPGSTLQSSVGSSAVAAPGQQTPRTNMRKSGIPVRSPPRNGSSPSSTRPRSVQRSSFTSSHSKASTLSRALSQSPSLKIDSSSVAFLESETPTKGLYPSGFPARLPHHDVRRVSHRAVDPSTTSMDHLPNSPADEQIRAQAAQAFSAAQQLLDFDDDEDAMAEVPVTPLRPIVKPTTPSMYRTPTSAYSGPLKQPWEDSPRAMTPTLLKALQSRGFERSWWTERRKLLDQMAMLKREQSSAGDSIEEDVKHLTLGKPSVSNLQSIALFCTAHPTDSLENSTRNHYASSRSLWSHTRLFDRIFEGLVNLLRPGLVITAKVG